VAQAADLGGGITPVFLAGVLTKRAALDDKIDDMRQAENTRDLATQDRIKAGNALYKEIVKLCNIGKDLYAKTDEAKYNDYVLYNNATGGEGEDPAPPAPPAGTATLHGRVRDNSNGNGIEGATIVLIQGGAEVFTALSGPAGLYNKTDIAPGMYDISFNAPGYDNYTVHGVMLSADATLEVDGLLMPGV
jgi:hypothetical protein